MARLTRWVKLHWATHIRSLLILGAVLVAARFVPSMFGSPLTLQETREELEAASQEIGWEAAIDAYLLAEDIEQRVNDERRARGLQPLVWHEGLAELARRWSEEMIASGYRHSPDSFRQLPDLQGIGENILMGPLDTGEAHVAWMESDGHRKNLLTPGYTAIGVGVVCRNDGRIWATQLFGMSLAAYPSGDISVPPQDPIVRQDSGLTC